MILLLFIAVAYLLGSLAFAVIVSRAMRLPDPRQYGSGNPGATNVLRSGRKMAAVLTLLGDALKGWGAVVLARILAPQFGLDDGLVLLCALAPVYAGLLMGWGDTAMTVLVITLLLVYRHKSNLIKLVSGQEARIGARK